MICVDTNVFVAYFRGSKNMEAEILQKALEDSQVLMNPFVLSELLSSPKLPAKIEKHLLAIERIEIDRLFFERAGLLRRQIYSIGKGISIADIYIAQACIDIEIPLLTIDQDLIMISENSELEIVSVH